MYSTSLTQAPEHLSLVPLNPTWTITVRDITPGTTARTLTVAISGIGTIYTWTESGQTTTPGFVSSYTYDGSTLTVALSTVTTQGTEFAFSTTYTDSLGVAAGASTYVAGEPSVVAQNPVNEAQDVSPLSSVLFDIGMTAPLDIVDAQVWISDVAAYDSVTGFSRPDYEGRAVMSARFASINANWRRAFDEDRPVNVKAVVGFKTSTSVRVQQTYEWKFNVAKMRTIVTRIPAFTAVDAPAARGIVEVFRTAGIAAVKPPTSTAPSALLLFYAVQHSGLSSLAPYLPGAGLLIPETSALRGGDLISPTAGYANLIAVEPFFEIFLRELVSDGAALPQEVEFLERAWRERTPVNRIAAVAAALLYAFPVSA